MVRSKFFIHPTAWLVIAILLPFIVTDVYIRHLLVLTVIFAILALSLDIIIGRMGQFSFGHQAFFGLGAYTVGILSVKKGIFPWFAFLAGITSAGIFGLVIGLISLRRARGFFLGIITLGVGQIVWLVAMKWSDLTGGTQGLPGIPFLNIRLPVFGKITLNTPLSYYYFALALLIFTVYIIHIWSNSRFGRAVSAIRENEELAKSIGINPFKYFVGAFTFACLLAGFSGAIYAYYMGMVHPANLRMYYMIWMLVMVILGGRRTFAGPIVGAFIFIFFPEWLAFTQEYRILIVGIILLGCILFMPQGIAPSLVLVWKDISARLRRREGQRDKVRFR